MLEQKQELLLWTQGIETWLETDGIICCSFNHDLLHDTGICNAICGIRNQVKSIKGKGKRTHQYNQESEAGRLVCRATDLSQDLPQIWLPHCPTIQNKFSADAISPRYTFPLALLILWSALLVPDHHSRRHPCNRDPNHFYNLINNVTTLIYSEKRDTS